MWVSEDLLVKDSCGHESFRKEIAFTSNLITSLRPYIQGHVSLKERSPSPKKIAPKNSSVHSRPSKKKKTKLSESESESSLGQHQASSCHLVYYHLTKIK